MKNKEVVGTIEIPHTWSDLLPVMLESYFTMRRSANPIAVETLKDIKQEFARMAQAADKWNKHVNEKNDENLGA